MRRQLPTFVLVLALAAFSVACTTEDSACAAGDCEDTMAVCDDPRTYGDGKQADDICWAPPEHYCAQGATQLMTAACDADGNCCIFDDGCLPCGWTECAYPCAAGQGTTGWTPGIDEEMCGVSNMCPDIPPDAWVGLREDGPKRDFCQRAKPDRQAVFCYDDL